MMLPIHCFDFDGYPIRVIVRDSEAWFVAADICDVLGSSQFYDTLFSLDDDDREDVELDTPSGLQSATVVSESGFYSLIMCSSKPAAKRFKKWLTGEVLPSIRDSESAVADLIRLLNDPQTLRALLANFSMKVTRFDKKVAE